MFESKVPPGAQSLFTAIGQLIVYTAGEAGAPRRVLVSRAFPENSLFGRAMKSTGIEHVRFEIGDGGIALPALASLFDD